MLELVDQLLEACETPYLFLFVVLGAYTGMRKGEMYNLRWQNVDLRRREFTVRDSKNNESRTIPMNDQVVAALKRHPQHFQSEFVLVRDDGEHYRKLDKGFKAALAKAELPRIRIHDLRHTFVSNLAMAGVPLNVVQELMGHKNIQMTMIYAHLAPNAKRAAVAMLMKRSEPGEERQTAMA